MIVSKSRKRKAHRVTEPSNCLDSDPNGVNDNNNRKKNISHNQWTESWRHTWEIRAEGTNHPTKTDVFRSYQKLKSVKRNDWLFETSIISLSHECNWIDHVSCQIFFFLYFNCFGNWHSSRERFQDNFVFNERNAKRQTYNMDENDSISVLCIFWHFIFVCFNLRKPFYFLSTIDDTHAPFTTIKLTNTKEIKHEQENKNVFETFWNLIIKWSEIEILIKVSVYT